MNYRAKSVEARNERPRLRPSVVVQHRRHKIRLLAFTDLLQMEFTVQPYVHDMLQLLDGTHSIDEILVSLNKEHDRHVSMGEVKSVLATLQRHHLLDRSFSTELPTELHSRQEEFLAELTSSHKQLSADTTVLQEQLRSSRVVVVGAGGTGSWVIQSLCASGVGYITVIDPDRVELSNLSRQALYRTDDIGSLKTMATAKRCTEFAPETKIVPVNDRVTEVNTLLPHLKGADLVVCCADEPSVAVVSQIVADACFPLKVPHIVGGGYGGNLGVPGLTVIPGRSCCWECLSASVNAELADVSYLSETDRTGRTGSISAITGMLANIISWEAVRILLGLPLALSGSAREFNIMTLEWRSRPVPSRTGCRCNAAGVPTHASKSRFTGE